MLKFLRWALVVAVLLVVAGLLSWRLWRGPDPADILAGISVPPAPVLLPDQELKSFRTAPGFRVELVAAEPLVVDPVAMDWDDEGRLYVVEMRGFMPDVDGAGEGEPLGRVVVLEDRDGDGRMDHSHVFLDGLVLPRAVAVLPEGVLVGAPPDLWLCQVGTAPGASVDESVCADKARLTHYAKGRHDPEHLENGLLAGVDGWIYNAKSNRRFRLEGDALQVEETVFRGQWGIAQDDEGRLFHNHNSAFLYGDAIPGEYATRQPGTASNPQKPGIAVALAEGAEVFGIRVAPGLNRAYLRGSLRADGRQLAPTGVSGLAIQRGDQYGPEFVGDAFVPEAAGQVVAHFAVERAGVALRAEHRTYPDPDYGQREFLASTDERFRPVDVKVGPDGCIWVIDMYRGVIQHANYVSEHLREYVRKHGLGPPGETGRIWRVVRDDRPLPRRSPSLRTVDEQLAGLDHPNAWVRDRAQRRLVHAADPSTPSALRRLGSFGPLGRRHALWTLAGLGALDRDAWQTALDDADPAIRRVALRAGEPLLVAGDPEAERAVTALLRDPDPAVRLQALHSLGAMPAARRPLGRILEAGRSGGPIDVQAAVSGIAGREREALTGELARTAGADADASLERWLRELAAADFLAARNARDTHAIGQLLDRVDSDLPSWQAVLVLDGIGSAQRRPGTERVELAGPHALFEGGPEAEVGRAVAAVRRHFTWPGDPRPGGARPLTPEEAALRQRGQVLYGQTCAACHGPDGRGQAGLAPSLVNSPWVRDADGWLVRIVLGGLTGPLLVNGEEWNLTMPAHGHDPRFDDEGVAGLLTHLRRAWGHAEEPVSPTVVGQIRAQLAGRELAWTAEELLALSVAHRLDPYTGVYVVPIVGLELEVGRRDTVLTLGIKGGGKAELSDIGGRQFLAEGVMVEFLPDDEGVVRSAMLHRDGNAFEISKQD